MIALNLEQGSEEWIAARLALPTASQFHRVITPKTAKLSSAADGYVHELIAEEMLGHALDEAESQFMERGTATERHAVEFYEFQRDTATTKVGLILSDDMRAGCSPDRLVGDEGGLEIKCPSALVHVAYMLNKDADKFRCQVQGALWLTGRAWWDWLSFNPELPPVLIRFERDEEFIAKLARAVHQFTEYLDECRAKLIREGLLAESTVAGRMDRLRGLVEQRGVLL